MSRETDSPSSGPKGRGGSSYPSGTETGEPGEGAKAGEPKTETTLTTRIRINIPGSRPIPPVVMRTPVSEDTEKGQAEGAGSGPGSGSGSASGEADSVPAPPDAVPGGVSSGAPVGAAVRGASAAAPADAAPASASASASGGDQGEGSGGSSSESDGEFTQQTSDWFAPRKMPKSNASSPPPSSPPTPPSPPAGGGDGRPDLPYFTDTRPRPEADEPGDADQPEASGGTPEPGSTTGSTPAFPGPEGHPETPAEGLPLLDPSLGRGGAGAPPGGPNGPTTGPATGEMPVPGIPGAPGATPPVPGTPPGTPPGSGAPGEPPAGSTLGLGTGPAPFAPDGAGTALYGDVSGDDPHLAGDPVVSGMPQNGPTGPGGPVPGGPGGPGGPGAPGAPAGANPLAPPLGPPGGPVGPGGPGGPGGPAVPPPPGPVQTAPAPGPAAAPPPPPAAKKGKGGGRNKLVLAGVAVVGVIGVAYGAGLMLDHGDVPKGTTVLGVDIGGMSKHEAVNKLDEAVGGRTNAAMKVVAGGQETSLKPSVAGLTLDTEVTVRDAAGRDYNPVSVIGSLFGGEREADPAIKVDDEKMESALGRVVMTTGGGSGGGATDGMVKFVGGKPVAVKGKPHKGIDTEKSSEALEQAYRERAASGKNSPVKLPVSMQQPKIGEQELNEAVNGFGKTAMSGWVWLKAGDVKVPFSEKTMGKFLTMRAGGDKLQPVIDPKALKATYGTAFDNVVIEGGAGNVKMTPQHAASAMVQALKKKAPPKPAERLAVVPGAKSQ
ncbi:hypothetical protein [Streptomyces sp. NPDC048172]|uniref:hypothetical protein n=1 Tax=Streptomyces sp. NPDC048172 TaxID=3365505 RepID=UPI003723F98D